jgi:hypothetical protein
MTSSTSASHGFNARRAHRAFDRLLEAFLKPHGLKTGYWYYLRVLWIEDGVSQKRLSEMNNVTENTTTAIIGAMARDGLVERNPTHGRTRVDHHAHAAGLGAARSRCSLMRLGSMRSPLKGSTRLSSPPASRS